MSYLVDLTHGICGQGRPVDVLLAELAAAQHGVVAVWQLYMLGLSGRRVEWRAARGRLHRIHRGVYAVGHNKLTERGRWMAAVLAFGKDALLSHRSAAAHRNLLRDGRSVIDVTVPGRTRKGVRGVVLHQPRLLHPDDIDVVAGIPTTSVARLLMDIAATGPFRHLERAFEAAERERLLDMRKLHELMDRSPGHRGRKPVIALTEQFEEPPAHTRSRLEQRFFALCRKAGIPTPAVNAWVGKYEVDMLWQGPKIIVELDSWGFHGTRAAFERDRQRDVDLQLAGYAVLRFTWRRLETDPAALLDAVERLIQARAPALL
jgi:predicted transcriptional regulator of viral defense system